MKKLLALGLAIVMTAGLFGFCISAAAAPKLDDFTVEDYKIGTTNATAGYGTPAIDGVIDDAWKTTTWYRSDPAAAWNSPDASEMYYYTAFMWDEGNLYIMVYAVNDREVLKGASGTRDRVSFYLDTLNEDNSSFGSGKGDFGAILYVYDPDADGLYSDGGITVTWRQYNESLDYDSLGSKSDYCCTYGDDWWIIEAKFAVSAYNPDVKFAEGNEAGIDMTVRDHGSSGDTKAVNFSTDWDAWEMPNEYGTVKFVKAPEPAVETVAPETAAPVQEVETVAPADSTPAPLDLRDLSLLLYAVPAFAALGGFTALNNGKKRQK